MPGKFTSVKAIRQKLTAKSFAPLKSLGQNFLTDENILRKIVGAGSLGKRDLVLEVGPGLGALTVELAGAARQVIAVEYDRGLFGILSESLADLENLHLINQDILETDLPAILRAHTLDSDHYKVIANLPYYITTPVIFKLLESGLPWELMVFLVQKEVAERFIARPGTKDYGALTVMLNFYGKVEKLGIVPRTVFYPAPQVDSAIVRITGSKSLEEQKLYPYLRQVVQAAFGQRRKTILNALATLGPFFGNKEILAACLQKLRIDPGRRGETLSLKEFLDLAMEICIRESKGCTNDIYQPN